MIAFSIPAPVRAALLTVFTLTATCGAALGVSLSHAEEMRYVSDTLYVQLRGGPSIEYRSLKVLPSGEHLVYLSEEEGFTQVRTADGAEGWVSSQYLMEQPIAREQLKDAQAEIQSLKAQLEVAQTAAAEAVRSAPAEPAEPVTAEDLENERLDNIIQDSPLLTSASRELGIRNQELELRVESLEAENEQLRKDKRNIYLLYGGGLVFIGIIAGLILPNLRGKRSNSGWA